MNMTSLQAAVLSFLAIGVASSVVAGEGRIPLWEAPTVITESGKYFLTRNLQPSVGNVSITINAPDVDLDLNGFTVDATGVGQPAIYIDQANNVAIRSGTVLGDQITHGIANVRMARVTIEDVTSFGSASAGIDLEEIDHIVLRRNVVERAANEGIWVRFPMSDQGSNGIIEHNSVRNTGGSGFVVQNARGIVVRLNQAKRCAQNSGSALQLRVTNSLIEQNLVETTDSNGMRFLSAVGNTVTGNTVRLATTAGMVFDTNSWDNFIAENVVTRTTAGNGIFLDGSDTNVVRDNISNANADLGLRFAMGAGLNVYQENLARGNCTAGPCACGVGVATDFCDEGAGNTDNGGNNLP